MKDEETTKKLRADWYKRAKEQTLKTLPAFMKELSEVDHDYNTICYAIGAAAVGAAWAMEKSPHGGITGFQGGAVMWEFMSEWNGVKGPARLLKHEDMLFPQYEEKYTSISGETFEWLQEEAKKKLAEKGDGHAHPNVIAHWRSIVAGNVPFGLRLEH